MILLVFTNESEQAACTFLTVRDKTLSTIKGFFQKEGKHINKKLEHAIKEWRRWSPISGQEKVTKLYAVEAGNPTEKLVLMENYEE